MRYRYVRMYRYKNEKRQKKKKEANSPAMTTHNFHNESALMRISCANYCVDTFDDTMQSRVGADRHIRAAKIVVDGSDHTGDVKMLVLVSLLGSNIACRRKKRKKPSH